MQIPFTYAEDIIGVDGANIGYIRQRSGATVTIQESPHPNQITVEIKGTSSQAQIAEQLIQVKTHSIYIYFGRNDIVKNTKITLCLRACRSSSAITRNQFQLQGDMPESTLVMYLHILLS